MYTKWARDFSLRQIADDRKGHSPYITHLPHDFIRFFLQRIIGATETLFWWDTQDHLLFHYILSLTIDT